MAISRSKKKKPQNRRKQVIQPPLFVPDFELYQLRSAAPSQEELAAIALALYQGLPDQADSSLSEKPVLYSEGLIGDIYV